MESILGRALSVFVGFAVALAGILVLLWVLWQLWKHREEEKPLPAIELKTRAGPETVEPLIVEAGAPQPEAAPVPDDLKRVEGIGPKIASVLQAAGVATFAQLAAIEASQIEQILEEADPRLRRLADPTTWPEQARLAAAGDWPALETLQSELKGGRHA